MTHAKLIRRVDISEARKAIATLSQEAASGTSSILCRYGRPVAMLTTYSKSESDCELIERLGSTQAFTINSFTQRVPVNPDGREAAARIRELTAALTVERTATTPEGPSVGTERSGVTQSPPIVSGVREAVARIIMGPRCDATKDEHVVMTEGRYRFCTQCGETITKPLMGRIEAFNKADAILALNAFRGSGHE